MLFIDNEVFYLGILKQLKFQNMFMILSSKKLKGKEIFLRTLTISKSHYHDDAIIIIFL